jgi:hypothetical protein
MTFVTDPITYNVHERGRKHRGQDRRFDTVALARLINSASVQEQVKHGDMMGYFGHWVREKFGMTPKEGAIVDGKAVALPASIRTVELSATDDGMITHRTEFFDTEAGIAAKALYDSKAGGFSSAITPVMGTSPTIPKVFHGFDYVYEPNYSTNRGHKVILDAIGPDVAIVLDAVMAQAAMEQQEMGALFDSLHGQHLTMLGAYEAVIKENEWLIARLAQKTGIDRQTLLDSVMLEDVEGGAARLRGTGALPDFEKFRDAKLEGLQSLPSDRPIVDSAETRYIQQITGRAI